jgi:DNA polymerase-4
MSLSPPSAARDLLLVDVDAFYASVERVKDPSLRGRPLVVGGGPGDRGVVLSASYEARACGVRAAMPLARAAALCPEATFVPPDPDAYAKASAEVMTILRTFSPRVEPASLDEAFLDVTGCQGNRPTWLDFGEEVHRAVLEGTGLPVSVGIGGTRTVAAVAASLAKPAGVMEVPRGEEAAFLANLPIEHLGGVGPKTREGLASLQVHTIGDLARLPEADVVALLGPSGASLSRRARGLDDRLVSDGRGAPKSISRDTSFAHDTRDPGVIGGTLSYLAQRAANDLRRQGLRAATVGVRLRTDDFRTLHARRRLPVATDSDREILGVVESLWRRRHDPRRALRLVGVSLLDLEGEAERQLPLFEGPETAALGAGVDRLRERHGFRSVLRGGAIERFLPTPPSARSA